MIKLANILLLVAPCSALAMQALDETQMGEVTGEGIGAVFDDVVIHSGDYGAPDDFQLRIQLTDDVDPEYLIFSELRFYKTGTEAGGVTSGGRFGSYEDPFYVGDLREITESHTGSVYAEGNRTHTALYTGFPAADLQQLQRNFYLYSGERFKPSARVGATSYYQGLPQNFFSGNASVNVGNLYSKSSLFDNYLAAQDTQLDQASDKFNLHFRLDSITDENRLLTMDDQFLAYVDVVGARLYGTSTYIWAHDNQGETLSAAERNAYQYNGQPVYADRGLALAMTTGLRADAIRIVTDSSGPAGVESSTVSLNNVDVYLPLGSVDQPVTLSTVKYDQYVRGQWLNGQREGVAKTQLRLEVAALPVDVGQAPQGNIFIQSIDFGSKDNEEIITGREDIYLRDATGNIVETVPNVAHRAFVPKTVIYNEQVTQYNLDNPSSPLPYIPNQNVVEIRGIEIQRLIITTQDL